MLKSTNKIRGRKLALNVKVLTYHVNATYHVLTQDFVEDYKKL